MHAWERGYRGLFSEPQELPLLSEIITMTCLIIHETLGTYIFNPQHNLS